MTAREIIIAIAGILIAAAASGQPRDWANFGRYSKQNDEIAGHKVNAVFMGNSITDNWARLDPEFFSSHGFVGRGISGQTTSEMLVRFRRDVLDLEPEAVAILAGINDIAQNNGYISLENTFGNIVSMCELAKAHRIKVIICSTLPCDRLSWRPEIKPAEQVKELNAMLKDYADRNRILFVDYWSVMANGNGGLDKEISGDGCHPNIDGYEIMEKTFLDATRRFKW
ncbi:MAG: acylhydrolase [Bacteroidetes bacterium]|uniref:Acylhydrolase n=1 Tax=Candidatus Cryptobacteroides intestinavium TaxID=2840766 RepID=A0A9D9ESE2_9BACT|nr:acylhydrolase [Candidatus Cryptobacteroides intestinavium]